MLNLFDCNNSYLVFTDECFLSYVNFFPLWHFMHFFRLYFLKHFTFVFKYRGGVLLLLIHFVYALRMENNIFILLSGGLFCFEQFYTLYNQNKSLLVKLQFVITTNVLFLHYIMGTSEGCVLNQ